MAVRNGDDQIASVLNRLGYTTGKAMRWNQNRVATARRNYSIPGQRRALPDPERISLNEAARLCGMSQHTIKRLVEAGLLKGEQVVRERRGRFAVPIWRPSRSVPSLSGSDEQVS